jgi:hypothetical protein
MPSETAVGLDKSAASDLRTARRQMCATYDTHLTMSEVVRRLVALWRQVSSTGTTRP